MPWRQHLPERTILVCEVGSTLHGIDIGSDDLDLMGICVEPDTAITGTGSFTHHRWRTQPDGVRSGPDDIDLVVYGLKRYIELAATGNPSVILPLLAPRKFLHHVTGHGHELRAQAKHLVSQQAIPRFLGYMRKQRERAEDGLSLGRGNYEDRQPKWASHLVRLGYELNELVETGGLMLPLPEPQQEVCRSIKRGDMSVGDAILLAEVLEEEAETKIPGTPLPETPNMDKVEAWMHQVYRTWLYPDSKPPTASLPDGPENAPGAANR